MTTNEIDEVESRGCQFFSWWECGNAEFFPTCGRKNSLRVACNSLVIVTTERTGKLAQTNEGN